MCAKALYEKEANVNIVLDFVLNLTTITDLYPGHKPIDVMIDSRSKEKFDGIKANKDKHTLKFDVFNTFPLLHKEFETLVFSWNPSIHHLKDLILFTTADQLQIHKSILSEPIRSTADQLDIHERVRIISKRNKFVDKV